MKRNRRNTPQLVRLVALGAFVFLTAYVLQTHTNRQHNSWDPQGFPIFMEIWEGFTDDLNQIQDGSNPKRALLEALDCWARISSLSIRAGETSISEVLDDGRNVVTIADTPNNRNKVGAALGKSLTRFFLSDLKHTENDVIFNPREIFTTIEPEDRASDLIDLLAVAKHEFGHSWNLGHSIQRSSTMFFAGPQFTNPKRSR